MSVNILLIIFVLIVVAMVAFILVQKGSGATAGSAFGSGASSTVFGAKGSGNFLTKTTMILAFLFFAISLLMAVNASKQFSAKATGEVDLGVMGKLDTSVSDVPELSPVENATSSDVPSIDVEKESNTATDAVNDVISNETDVPSVVSAVEQVVEEKATEMKEAASDKIDALKQEAIEKVEEVKDDAAKKVQEKVDS